jgi:hypothetical protein
MGNSDAGFFDLGMGEAGSWWLIAFGCWLKASSRELRAFACFIELLSFQLNDILSLYFFINSLSSNPPWRIDVFLSTLTLSTQRGAK